MLVGPLLAVVAMRFPGPLSALAAAFCAALFAFQPDFAASAALAASAGVALAHHRDRWSLVGASSALVGAAICWAQPDPLRPAAFVENIIPSMTANGGLAALTALMLATCAPCAARDGRALAAWQASLVIAALAGSYPTPLIGYGAAPILGYALALGLMGGKSKWRYRN